MKVKLLPGSGQPPPAIVAPTTPESTALSLKPPKEIEAQGDRLKAKAPIPVHDRSESETVRQRVLEAYPGE